MKLFSKTLTCFSLSTLILVSCSKDDPSPEAASVKDIDGNVYPIVKIGNQTWMAENLRVTKLNDGTPIPAEPNANTWATLTSPAYSAYSNTEANLTKYGALYNWFAVNSGKLCPTGWHVPTVQEWTEMKTYLAANGYNYDGSITTQSNQIGNKIGKALATTSGWTSSSKIGAVGNTDFADARNKSGFSASPGGYRNVLGQFLNVNTHGYWWTTSGGRDGSAATYIGIYYDEAYVWYYEIGQKAGVSCRCVKD